MLTKRDHTRPDVLQLPYVPDAISEADMIDGVFLYAATDRKKLLSYLKKKYTGNDIRVSKKELSDRRLPSRYTVIVFDNRYYLMYLGRQHNRHAGAGAFGVVKYLQDLETGEFDHVMKIFSERHQAPGEMKPHHVDAANLSTYHVSEYRHLQVLGDASENLPIWRVSQVKGMQLLQPQKTKKGVDLNLFMKNYQLLHGIKIRDPQYILTILMNMCMAVNVIHHQKRLLHRDIKLSNFMVNPQTAEVELIDFGFAISIDTQFNESSARMGTLSCVAPEIVVDRIPGYSKKSDAFALGASIASAFDIADINTGGFLSKVDGKFVPRSLKRKTSVITGNPLLSAIYDICQKLLLVDPVDRMDIPTAYRKFCALLKTYNKPVKLLAFNISDFIGLADEAELIDFLSRCKARQIVIIVDEEDKNNPLLTHSMISFTRLAQRRGYIVHADAVIVSVSLSNAEILQHVVDYFDEASPLIRFECSFERFVTECQQQYLDALTVVIEKIPNRSVKIQYAEKFSALLESGASVKQIVAALKMIYGEKLKKGLNTGALGIFSKNDKLTRQIIDVISKLDMNVAFGESRLSVLASQFTHNRANVKRYHKS